MTCFGNGWSLIRAHAADRARLADGSGSHEAHAAPRAPATSVRAEAADPRERDREHECGDGHYEQDRNRSAAPDRAPEKEEAKPCV